MNFVIHESFLEIFFQLIIIEHNSTNLINHLYLSAQICKQFYTLAYIIKKRTMKFFYRIKKMEKKICFKKISKEAIHFKRQIEVFKRIIN